jgi:hypothetical protein
MSRPIPTLASKLFFVEQLATLLRLEESFFFSEMARGENRLSHRGSDAEKFTHKALPV